MESTRTKEINMEYAIRLGGGTHIGNDILLIDDMTQLQLPQEPMHMQCILLALCLKGSAHYFVDSVEHVVEPGDLIIINRGRVTYDSSLSPDCEGIGVLIDDDFFHESIKNVNELTALFLFARRHPVFRLPETKVECIKSAFHRMKDKAAETTHHFRTQIVQSLLLTMVYEVSDAIYLAQAEEGVGNTRAYQIFTQFLLLVEKHFRTERRVGWYSQQLCISPKYLSETVKAVSKRTPNEWIDSYVVMELRMLLSSTSMSIKEIAQQLNFSNQSFLGKFFKEHTGMSPSEYRKK
jgi:AraC family transcriptional regulator, transcriptional activator of pobA